MNLAYLKQQLDPFIIQIIKNQNSPSGPYYKLNHNPHIEYQEFLHNYEDEIQEITNKDILNLDDIDELLNHMTKSVGKNRLRPYHNLLPILYVKAFRLYYFEGLNYREIGSRMNISSMTIHNYVKLALDYVKKTLKDRGKL
jgi:DNA-directed RNA polymerase specialized sigma24 family protein